jgi:hypothetical protein
MAECIHIDPLDENIRFQDLGDEHGHTSDVLIISLEEQSLNIIGYFSVSQVFEFLIA